MICHAATVGQFVPNVKAVLSKDIPANLAEFRRMANTPRELQFNQAYIARVKALREAKGWTSEQMAIALGIPAERYRKYESRSPLPTYLLEAFAQITDADPLYVLTGKRASARKAHSPA